MGVRENVRHAAAVLVFEVPNRTKALDIFRKQLEASGKRLLARVNALSDTEFNRRVFNHIIGIERWGQRRLRVALGEPFIHDEYNGYRPPREADWETLKREFQTTRADTVALVGQLQQADITNVRILHNFYGNLSVRSWLRYLEMHAGWESRKMR
jgi:hypothetical protein